MSKKSIKELYFEVRDLIGPAEFDRRIRNWLMRQLRNVNGVPAADGEHKSKLDQQCEEILSDLNQRWGSRYRVTDENKRIIRYWLDKGRTVEDFFLVHAHRIIKWKDNYEMRDFIRPSTLYRKKHFDEYLAQAEADKYKNQYKDIKSEQHKPELTESEQERHERVMQVMKDLARKKRVSDDDRQVCEND